MSNVCKCGFETEPRQVTKESINKGRYFVMCPNGRRDEGGCGWFQWVKDPNNNNNNNQPPAPVNKNPNLAISDRLDMVEQDIKTINQRLYRLIQHVKSNTGDDSE